MLLSNLYCIFYCQFYFSRATPHKVAAVILTNSFFVWFLAKLTFFPFYSNDQRSLISKATSQSNSRGLPWPIWSNWLHREVSRISAKIHRAVTSSLIALMQQETWKSLLAGKLAC